MKAALWFAPSAAGASRRSRKGRYTVVERIRFPEGYQTFCFGLSSHVWTWLRVAGDLADVCTVVQMAVQMSIQDSAVAGVDGVQ